LQQHCDDYQDFHSSSGVAVSARIAIRRNFFMV